MAGPGSFWPLFDLVVRTPRLELRLPRDEDLAAFVELVDGGIHDPATMPFFVPWTDVEPARRARETAQWLWSHRVNWSPDKWTFTAGVFVGGRPVGIQDIGAENFRAVRSVETGSWLGRAHQGQGYGREMREAILHLAFAGLGAEEALSGAFEDNAASLAVSRAVGYAENGQKPGVGGATGLAARSGSAWVATPGNDDAETTLRLPVSTAVSTCSSVHHQRRESMSTTGHGSDAVMSPMEPPRTTADVAGSPVAAVGASVPRGRR